MLNQSARGAVHRVTMRDPMNLNIGASPQRPTGASAADQGVRPTSAFNTWTLVQAVPSLAEFTLDLADSFAADTSLLPEEIPAFPGKV
jgi:hypothetical protein